jgi:UMF1 family MFS transporter
LLYWLLCRRLKIKVKLRVSLCRQPVVLMTAAVLCLWQPPVTFIFMKEHAAKPQWSRPQKDSQWRRSIRLRKPSAYKDFMQLDRLCRGLPRVCSIAITFGGHLCRAGHCDGFEPQETMVLIFVLNIAALIGSLVSGYAQDRIGHQTRPCLALTALWGWAITLYFGCASPPASRCLRWAAALAGYLHRARAVSPPAGPWRPCSFLPNRLAEFIYGLWTFAVRLASIVGPMGYGLITWLTDGNQRLAIAATTGLFVLGWLLLLPANVQRGRQKAAHQTVHECSS